MTSNKTVQLKSEYPLKAVNMQREGRREGEKQARGGLG